MASVTAVTERLRSAADQDFRFRICTPFGKFVLRKPVATVLPKPKVAMGFLACHLSVFFFRSLFFFRSTTCSCFTFVPCFASFPCRTPSFPLAHHGQRCLHNDYRSQSGESSRCCARTNQKVPWRFRRRQTSHRLQARPWPAPPYALVRTPSCGHQFFTSHEARLKHYQDHHRVAADEFVYKVGFAPKNTPSTPTPWGRMVPLG